MDDFKHGDLESRPKFLPTKETLEHTREIIPQGETFWRARIKNEDIPAEKSKQEDESGPAPPGKPSNGRMNPPGISYLYIASDPRTSITEIRPKVGDKVWLGEFKTKRALKISNLQDIPSLNPQSIFDDKWSQYNILQEHALATIGKEISLPTKNNAPETEYLLTQILSEYISSLGFDGIRYPSSLTNHGYNIVLFCTKHTRHPNWHQFNNHIRSYKDDVEFVKITTRTIKEITIVSD